MQTNRKKNWSTFQRHSILLNTQTVRRRKLYPKTGCNTCFFFHASLLLCVKVKWDTKKDKNKNPQTTHKQLTNNPHKQPTQTTHKQPTQTTHTNNPRPTCFCFDLPTTGHTTQYGRTHCCWCPIVQTRPSTLFFFFDGTPRPFRSFEFCNCCTHWARPTTMNTTNGSRWSVVIVFPKVVKKKNRQTTNVFLIRTSPNGDPSLCFHIWIGTENPTTSTTTLQIHT